MPWTFVPVAAAWSRLRHGAPLRRSSAAAFWPVAMREAIGPSQLATANSATSLAAQ